MVDQTLRQCFYDGVPFYIETIQESGGRRLSINEFPYQINSYIEDVGQKNTSLSVTGYLMDMNNSNTPYKEINTLKNTLADAFANGEVGLLELSYYPKRLKVRCSEYNFTLNGTTKIDFTVTFHFIKEIKPKYSIISYRLNTNNLFLTWITGALQSLSRIVNFDLSAIYPYKSYLAQLKIAKDYITSLFRGVTITDDAVSSNITDRINNLSKTDYVDYFNLIADIATYEKTGNFLSVFVETLNYEPKNEVVTGRSNTRIKMSETEKVLTHAFKQAFIGAYAVCLVQTQFETREQAVYHRANLSDTIDTEYDFPIEDTMNQLTDLVNATSTYITNELANLSTIVTIEGHNQFLPATYWSYRLYGNLDYVDDLITRNNLSDPDFMPLSFKATSI